MKKHKNKFYLSTLGVYADVIELIEEDPFYWVYKLRSPELQIEIIYHMLKDRNRKPFQVPKRATPEAVEAQDTTQKEVSRTQGTE